MQEPVTLIEGFGETAGRYFPRRARSHGSRSSAPMRWGASRATANRVSRVVTQNGVELDAELVVIGAGVTPEVTLAKAADLRSA